MAYCRFDLGVSDVYVFSSDKGLNVIISADHATKARNKEDLSVVECLDYLLKLRYEKGLKVPEKAMIRLRQELFTDTDFTEHIESMFNSIVNPEGDPH